MTAVTVTRPVLLLLITVTVQIPSVLVIRDITRTREVIPAPNVSMHALDIQKV